MAAGHLVSAGLLLCLGGDAEFLGAHPDQVAVARRAGRCSQLTALEPVAPGGDRVFLTEVARMARVGRAAVVNWYRRNDDFPAPVAGTDARRTGRRSVLRNKPIPAR
ncbi:hypothetical protein [Streptomyces lavendulae]